MKINSFVFFMGGIAETKKFITFKIVVIQASLTAGKKNVINIPLVQSEKGYLPPLHIKLGLMKTSCRQ